MRSLNSNLLTLILLSHLSCFHVLLVEVSAKVFISIDCGSSSLQPYLDENSIEWVGDKQYIQTGKSRNVINESSRLYTTVREFPSRKKNCYSLDVNNDKSEHNTKVEKVLVRATFYYGNYDSKSKPPTFNLQFNGNIWTQVETTMEYLTTEEVVYSLKHGNTITVCLAQTQPDNIPFISTLEVRSLDSDMYSYVDSNYPLIFKVRKAYGTNKIIRYPEDSYDRIWYSDPPESATTLLSWAVNSSPAVKVSISDKIPEALFRTALTSLNSSGKISRWDIINNLNVPLNFNAYFTEVIQLNSTQKRTFDISVLKSGESDFSVYDTVSPPYGEALQVRIENVTTDSDDYWQIDLVPTKDSTLPPLISALEGYIIGDKLVQGTNSNDVKSLALLQKSFIQLRDWQGDPCLPKLYNWEWIACDPDSDSPRITALYLNDFGLVGNLPDLSAMDALEIIDLYGNSLTQEIPEFLGTFPKLQELNLAYNNFSGAIPSSLLKDNNLKLNVSGNPNLSDDNTRNNTGPRIPS